MNILIIGGTGFIGTHILEFLSVDAENMIRVYSPSAKATIKSHSNVQTFEGRIEDLSLLKEHVEWADIIIHLSSTTTPQTSIADPYFDSQTNLLPLIVLLEKIKNRKTKIIFCSSGGSIYGNSNMAAIKEEAPKNPKTPYGITKLAMEEYILHYHNNYQVPYLIIRPSNVYGPNKKAVGKLGIINTLIYNSINDLETTIWANPDNIRDYIFIDDFINAFRILFNQNTEGILNVGSGIGNSLKEIIEMVENEMQKEVKIIFQKSFINDEPANILDIQKIMSLTAWKPQVKLPEGINRISQYFRNNR